MKGKWIEHVKTAALVVLVVISFVLTGFLWFSSAPSYETNPYEAGYVPPYIFNDGNYNKKEMWQLASPLQLIVHRSGKTFWLLPEGEGYRTLTKIIREASLEDPKLIPKPNADLWKKLFFQAPGVELAFSRDLPVPELDAFFLEAIRQKSPLFALDSVSRVWVFEDPASAKTFIWFISDRQQRIVQAEADLKDLTLSGELDKLSAGSGPTLHPVPAGGKAPWDPAGDKEPFSRILYLPEQPHRVSRWSYQLNSIQINAMKSWLFNSFDIEPIDLKPGEHVYISNEQMLTWNENGNFMTYNDTSVRPETGSLSVNDDLDTINSFVRRHRGWTGNYLLDGTEPTETRVNQYRFRLLIEGIPVYWEKSDPDAVSPDLILLTAGTGEVSRYSRSMLYLSSQSRESDRLLPGKDELLKRIAAEKIPPASVRRIFPAYLAKPSADGKRVILEPAWAVMTDHREPLFITSP